MVPSSKSKTIENKLPHLWINAFHVHDPSSVSSRNSQCHQSGVLSNEIAPPSEVLDHMSKVHKSLRKQTKS